MTIFEQTRNRLYEREYAQMGDSVTITRQSAQRTYDAGSSTYAVPTVAVYSGRAKFRPPGFNVGYDVKLGEGDVRLNRYTLTLPRDTAVEVNDFVVVTAAIDPGFVGRRFRVTDVLRDRLQVSRKCFAEEVT